MKVPAIRLATLTSLETKMLVTREVCANGYHRNHTAQSLRTIGSSQQK